MNQASRSVRDDVLEMLRAYGGEEPADEIADNERIDSLKLAWLVHQAEVRYAVGLDLDDEQLTRMGTVPGAIAVLEEIIGDGRGLAAADGHGHG